VLIFLSLLLQELPSAWWAYAGGQLARVTVHSSGAQTEVAGAPLRVGRRLVAVLLGSAAIALLGVGLLQLGRHLNSFMLVELGRIPLLLGIIQLLPLTPFKLGILLREQVGHWARVKHALASLGFSVAVLMKHTSYLGLPLVLVVFLAWLSACGRELWSSLLKVRDLRLAPDERLAEIHALTLGNEPQRALRLGRELWRAARSQELRARAGCAVAWAAIGSGNSELARDVISELPERSLDVHLVASYLAISDRAREAVELLEFAKSLGFRSVESFKLLADLYFRLGERDRLRGLLRSAVGVLSEPDLRSIERALGTLSNPSEAQPAFITYDRLYHAHGN
jgi:hypothetical protein